MNIDTHDLLNSIMKSFDTLQYIHPEDIPDIDLYMDQVTTFMEQRLRSTARNPEDDKILTKTMINNYAKNKLIPSPEKKKYTSEHMLLLIFIYYFKGIMSINDIQTLMGPLTEKYFDGEGGSKLADIYEEIVRLEMGEMDQTKKDVIRKFHAAGKTFENAEGENQELLQLFSFICELSFDVYLKKLLIEKMIDDMKKIQEKDQPRPAEKDKLKKKNVSKDNGKVVE